MNAANTQAQTPTKTRVLGASEERVAGAVAGWESGEGWDMVAVMGDK
jgi:hypothetical protein